MVKLLDLLPAFGFHIARSAGQSYFTTPPVAQSARKLSLPATLRDEDRCELVRLLSINAAVFTEPARLGRMVGISETERACVLSAATLRDGGNAAKCFLPASRRVA